MTTANTPQFSVAALYAFAPNPEFEARQGPLQSLGETNRVIGRGQTSGGIDDVVNTPVLVGPQRTPTWWWIGISITGPPVPEMAEP